MMKESALTGHMAFEVIVQIKFGSLSDGIDNIVNGGVLSDCFGHFV